MKHITIDEKNLHAVFRVNDDRTVELTDISGIADSKELQPLPQEDASVKRLHQLLAVQITGESATDMHAYKHNAGSESTRFFYKSHSIDANALGRLLKIGMESEHGLAAEYRMQFFAGLPIVRVETTVTNVSAGDIGIDYISSFYYGGVCKNGSKDYYDKTDLCVPFNSWSNEAQWKTFDAAEVGLSYMPVRGYNLPDKGNNRFHYENTGSWSTCEHLPMGFAKDRETGEIYYFEIEHSGSWQVEYGSDWGRNLYVALMGPDDESFWWKNLKPGQSFTTVPASFGVTLGDENDAMKVINSYRRLIRRENQDDQKCSVIFNDYMNCLMGDPTEEKEKRIIDLASEIGCEYYCMDCGWYDKGPWWDKVGEWKESKERFPDGMKAVVDYAKSRGMKMGLWLEIEVMGTAWEKTKELPDDWFICLHGKRRIDNKRYLLDFRNPEVRKYTMDVVDRLIRDYGVEYFKIDYNVTTGPGSDLNCDSCGDAMLEHYRALYDWIREIYRKHPDLVIENCGSGAQRMDYGILSLHSLQSTSDQTDYISNSYIASNVACAVTPEQAGMWVYPYVDEREHVIYNMVNGLLLRPYMSGLVWNMSRENLDLLKEGVSLYKDVIRKDLTGMQPFWPAGFNKRNAPMLSYGLMNDHKAYLSVFMPHTAKGEIDLSVLGRVPSAVKVLYPSTEDCSFRLEQNQLSVKMPAEGCARLFEIDF